jgi:hypothetical protein
MSPRRFSVIAVVILGTAAMHVVIYGIGISEAVDGVAAVAEGHDRGRCHEAKRGESGDHHSRAKAEPTSESPHYALSVVGKRRYDKPHANQSLVSDSEMDSGSRDSSTIYG